MFFRSHIRDSRLELQAEINCRINKGGDRRERNAKLCRDLVEAESYGKSVLAYLKIPELVLQHDRHLVRETVLQMRRDRYAFRTRFEGDVEMMRARQFAATMLNFSQDTANHGAERFLDDLVIRDQAVRGFISHIALNVGPRASAVKRFRQSWRRFQLVALARADCLTIRSAMQTTGRTGSVERKTAETSIEISVNLDGTGKYDVSTGIGFLDHMVEQFSKHSLIDVVMKVDGDLHVDQHHTTEDSAIALGQAISDALGDKAGIGRYGSAYSPMDETLARVALDISGRPYCVWKAGFTQEKLGEWDTELIRHWFESIAQSAGITLHVELLYGENNHHICEAIYKGFARAMRIAVETDARKGGAIPSTKGQIGG